MGQDIMHAHDARRQLRCLRRCRISGSMYHYWSDKCRELTGVPAAADVHNEGEQLVQRVSRKTTYVVLFDWRHASFEIEFDIEIEIEIEILTMVEFAARAHDVGKRLTRHAMCI